MDVDLSALGRFAHAELLIMTSLASGPKHGYAMMEDIRQTYGTNLGPGTLYTALSRLETRGLIEPTEPESRRRPYRLTQTGASTLQTQLDALDRFARSGLERLAPS